MSKRKFIGKQKVTHIDPTPEEFVQAVQAAEKIVIASMAEKKHVLEPCAALTFLALCTKAVLVRSNHFTMSNSELEKTVYHILIIPGYTPGPDFPYTIEQMAESLRGEP